MPNKINDLTSEEHWKRLERSHAIHAYVLNEKNEPVSLTDAEFLKYVISHSEGVHRVVGRAEVNDHTVLTDFVGSDMNVGRGTPLTFETIVYKNTNVVNIQRYSTWKKAEAGHTAIVAELSKKKGRRK